MKRILLVAGVVAIGLIVTVCVHAASTTVAEKAAANDPEASLPVVTEPAEPAPVQPVEPETTEPAEPAPSQPAEPASSQPVEPATAEPAPQENSSGAVSEEMAKETALATAGVRESDTTYLYVMPEYDDGRSVYNVEFLVGTTEYEFEIDANTGQVLEYDADSIYD